MGLEWYRAATTVNALAAVGATTVDYLRARLKTETLAVAQNYVRNSPRMPSKRIVRALSVAEDGPWLISLKDISLEGVGLVARRAFPVGSVLALELSMRNGMVCRAARVRNLRPSAHERWTVGCLFVDPLAAGDIVIQGSSQPTKQERRSNPRFNTQYTKGQCRVLNMTIDGPWPMSVHNVSETGIGLIADRPFKAGMVLSVELPIRAEATPLRVAHSSKHRSHWLIGCEFFTRLSAEHVRALT